MRLDKKFLSQLLDVPEGDIGEIKGMTFELKSAAKGGPVSFESVLYDRHKKKADELEHVPPELNLRGFPWGD